jgi:hypothetical protein
MSEDMKNLVEKGELTLRLKSGEVVARLAPDFALPIMAANGAPPDALMWGARFFLLSETGQYVEGMIFPLLSAKVLT